MIAQYLTRLSLLLLAFALCVRVLSNPAQAHAEALLQSASQPPRILLLTAHPDDECMFFAPTITSLISPHDPSEAQKSPEVFSLCLSVGNADGLGTVRRDELSRSLDVLGIEEGRRSLVDIPELQDNITARWDAGVIADTIKPYILENKIDTILTFDYEGISLHPNHRSLPHGVAHIIQHWNPEHEGRPAPRAFALITVHIVHKYLGPSAALLARADLAVSTLLQPARSKGTGTGAIPVFVAGVDGYLIAVRAMRAHRSQLVWFRWLYVVFSRYMWLNEWVEIVPKKLAAAAQGYASAGAV